MSAPDGTADATVPGNLTRPLTSFVGRKQELATLERLITASRLVTVTGVGGIGKTRLAVEYARCTASRYRHGAWLLDLAPLTVADALPNVVSATLGLMDSPERSALDGLTHALAERELLIVFDNCEHVVESCAQLVDALLGQCERLRILATSREILGVTGETTWRLPSLTAPDVTHGRTPAELQQFEAVELFLNRTQGAFPDFRLSEENADTVCRICRRLDGIPLAIELAAARTRTMPLSVIDDRLHHEFALAASRSRGLPRQGTMQATLDWSYNLLNQEEQRLFRRLALFRGGFTLGAAEYVGGDDDSNATGALDIIARLVDKSLVILEDRARSAGRYRLLEPVREYALDRLTAEGELEATAARHAGHFFRFGAAVRDGLRGREQALWIQRIEDDLENVRACFEWAVVHDMESALRLTLDLERYERFARRGGVDDWLDRSIAAASAPTEMRAHALGNRSLRKTVEGRHKEARELADASLECARIVGSALYEGKALAALAVAALEDHGEGEGASMWPLFDQAEELIRSTGEAHEIANVLNAHGYMRFRAGDPDTARPKLREALLLARELDDLLLITLVEGSLADAENAAGDRDAAQAGWTRELELAGALGSLVAAFEGLAGLGRLTAEDGDALRSLTLLAAAEEVLRQSGSTWYEPHLTSAVRAARARAATVCTARDADLAWQRGSRMTFAEAVAYGLSPVAPRGSDAPSAEPVPAAVARGGFAREGEYWALEFAGIVVRVRDRKGLQDLAQLIAAPRTQIAAVDLAVAETRPRMPEARGVRDSVGSGIESGVGPALDSEARRQYRERLYELEDDVANAEAANDPERAARARLERDFVVDELKAAVGLLGRDRRMLDPAERARKAVTGRIRDAINHIAAAHPELGEHLRRSIRTGTFCVYDPPVPTTWSL